MLGLLMGHLQGWLKCGPSRSTSTQQPGGVIPSCARTSPPAGNNTCQLLFGSFPLPVGPLLSWHGEDTGGAQGPASTASATYISRFLMGRKCLVSLMAKMMLGMRNKVQQPRLNQKAFWKDTTNTLIGSIGRGMGGRERNPTPGGNQPLGYSGYRWKQVGQRASNPLLKGQFLGLMKSMEVWSLPRCH